MSPVQPRPFRHIVALGESLSEIAARHGVTALQIIEANPHKECRIHAGLAVFVQLDEEETLALPPFSPYP